MLRLSTRLFAAGTLAAMLIACNQGAFAHEAKAKGAKAAKAEAPCCAMCAKKEVAVAKTTAKVAPAKNAKGTALKSGKPVVKTTVSAKMTPKVAAKPVAAKASAQPKAEEGPSCCMDEDAKM